jgi:hypothetical protein
VRVHILGKKIRPFWPFLDGLVLTPSQYEIDLPAEVDDLADTFESGMLDAEELRVIDDGQQYSVVKKDWEFYAPKVSANGFILVDDYGPAYPDVIRAVDEYFASGCPFTILHKTYFLVAQRMP